MLESKGSGAKIYIDHKYLRNFLKIELQKGLNRAYTLSIIKILLSIEGRCSLST